MELDDLIRQRGEGALVDDVIHAQSPKWGQGEPFEWNPSVTPTECDFGTYPGLLPLS